MEKLSPVLAFYIADGWLEGCHRCIDLLNFGGIGHTMAIHSNDKEIILKFALEKPAFRIIVNSPASLGAVGYTTALDPSMTLGVGTWGGSIISQNVTAKHLMNVKTVAFEVNPINKGKTVTNLDDIYKENIFSSASGTFTEQIEERLRARAGNPDFSTNSIKKQKMENVSIKKKYGSGISEEDIQKIIKAFNP
jgi:acetaldehyde dehydrogenase (acetylating)